MSAVWRKLVPMRTASYLAILIAACNAFGAAVTVNGTCQVGNCASPDVVSTGNTPSTAFNFLVTLPNSDQYRIAGTINPSTGSNTVGINSPFTVLYLGNAAGTASGADVINLDVLQNFTLSFPFRMSTESAQGGFGGAIAQGSSVEVPTPTPRVLSGILKKAPIPPKSQLIYPALS